MRSLFERTGGYFWSTTPQTADLSICLQVLKTGAEVWQSDAASVMLFDRVAPAAISGPIGDIQSALDVRLLERRWRARLADLPVTGAAVCSPRENVSSVAAAS